MNARHPRRRSAPRRPNPLIRAVGDSYVMAVRNLRRMVRTPQLVAFQAVQPVTFTLLLLYVFGGAIHTPGLRYIDYLIPGILVQATLFGGGTTTVGIAQDLSSSPPQACPTGCSHSPTNCASQHDGCLLWVLARSRRDP